MPGISDYQLKRLAQSSVLSTGDHLLDTLFPEEMLQLSASEILKNLVRSGEYEGFARQWAFFKKGKEIPAESKRDISEDRTARCSPSDLSPKKLAEFLNRLIEKIYAIYTHQATARLQLPSLDQIRWTSEHSGVPFKSEPSGNDTDMFYGPNITFPSRGDGDNNSLSISMLNIQLVSKNECPTFPDALRHLRHLSWHLLSGFSSIDRNFTASMVVDSTVFTLVVHDCSGEVLSRQYDIHNDPVALLRVLAGLIVVRLHSYILGGGTSFFVHTLQTGKRVTCLRVQGVLYQVIKNIFCAGGVVGRRTMIWLVRRKDMLFVLKDCWVKDAGSASRGFAELDILKYVEGVEGIMGLVSSEIVQELDYARNCMVNSNSARFRAGISPHLWEGRKHYRLILTPFGQSLTSFKCLKEFVSGLIDIVAAHECLWVEKKVLHRDISLNNLMLYDPKASIKSILQQMFSDDDTEDIANVIRRGLLIDFDCAIICDEEYDPQNAMYCGTIPYIAQSILRNPKSRHQPWHDLESFFYVIFYVLVRYAGPKGQKRQNFDFNKQFPNYADSPHWDKMAAEKHTLFGTEKMFTKLVIPSVDDYFKPLVPMLTLLRGAVFGDKGAEDRHRITHEEILGILRGTLEDLCRPERQTGLREEIVNGESIESTQGHMKRKGEDETNKDMPQIRTDGVEQERIATTQLRRSARNANKKVKINYKY